MTVFRGVPMGVLVAGTIQFVWLFTYLFIYLFICTFPLTETSSWDKSLGPKLVLLQNKCSDSYEGTVCPRVKSPRVHLLTLR